jgi:hypothetical protein
MNLRLVVFAAAALAVAFAVCLALGRWATGAYRDLLAIARGVQRGEELDAHFELRWRHDAAKRVLAADFLREAEGLVTGR